MYKIYTIYFSNKIFKNWDRDDYIIPVCADLHRYIPFTKWYKELAPDLEIVQQFQKIRSRTKRIKEWFTGKYLYKLKVLRENGTLDKYSKELQELVKFNDVYLLCYERPNQFCHRHLLAAYLNKFYDLGIEEY